MSKNQIEYKNIAQSTWIFGNAKILVMIATVIRTKCVAIFIGASGYGVLSLYTSALGLISTIINLGIGTSSVKDLAKAKSEDDNYKILKTVFVIRRISWVMGIIGTVLTAVFSVQISQFIFDTPNFWLGFCWLSIAVFLNQLTSANSAILRGLQKTKKLANANVTGAIIGLIISIPLYYYIGKSAIVPAILVSSAASYIRSWYFTKDITIEAIDTSSINLLKEGKPMIFTGLVLSVATIFTLIKSLLIRLYIEENGGLDEVGLFHSGFLIINTYLGVIFSIMSMDYFPSLISNLKNEEKLKSLINKQLIFGLTLILPMVCVFLIAIEYVISILLSEKFLYIEEMLAFAILGTIFKLFAWIHSYVILSKGYNKIYLFNESTAVIITLAISCIGYYFDGISGLGWGYTIGFIYYALQTSILSYLYNGKLLKKESYLFFALSFTIILLTWLFTFYYKIYFLSLIMAISSIAIAFISLKKMGLMNRVLKVFKK